MKGLHARSGCGKDAARRGIPTLGTFSDKNEGLQDTTACIM